MSKDIQFISLVDAIDVTGVEDIEGSSPRTLRVTALKGLLATVKVLINDYGVEDFSIVSDRVLLVVPGSTFDDVLVTNMEIDVVVSRLTEPRNCRLVFGAARYGSPVEGLQKLVQQVTKSLLSNLGSNRYNPAEGGDIVRACGMGLSTDTAGSISSVIAQAVSRTETQFFGAQASAKGLALDERLLRLEFKGVTVDEASGTVSARVKLVSFAGSQQEVPITL